MPVFSEKLRYIPHCDKSVVNSADFGKYLRMENEHHVNKSTDRPIGMTPNRNHTNQYFQTFLPLGDGMWVWWHPSIIRATCFVCWVPILVLIAIASENIWINYQLNQSKLWGAAFVSLTCVLEAFGQIDCLVQMRGVHSMFVAFVDITQMIGNRINLLRTTYWPTRTLGATAAVAFVIDLAFHSIQCDFDSNIQKWRLRCDSKQKCVVYSLWWFDCILLSIDFLPMPWHKGTHNQTSSNIKYAAHRMPNNGYTYTFVMRKIVCVVQCAWPNEHMHQSKT